jgi:hypothetical protein
MKCLECGVEIEDDNQVLDFQLSKTTGYELMLCCRCYIKGGDIVTRQIRIRLEDLMLLSYEDLIDRFEALFFTDETGDGILEYMTYKPVAVDGDEILIDVKGIPLKV